MICPPEPHENGYPAAACWPAPSGQNVSRGTHLSQKMLKSTCCRLIELLYQWKAAEAILLLPADRAPSRTGWAQRSPLLKMDSMDSGRLGTQAASHKFGIHEFKGILSGFGTFNCFPKKTHKTTFDSLRSILTNQKSVAAAISSYDASSSSCDRRAGLRSALYFPCAFRYCSSLTFSSHSLEQFTPGASIEKCENQLSEAAPCQCLTPVGMFTQSPGYISTASLPHS